LVAAGWITIPTDTTLDKAEAAGIFATTGAWNQKIKNSSSWHRLRNVVI
jgi:hypothetical protein